MSDFDFIIVGGGSAGCVLARRLSDDPSLHVCLIEAGAKARNPAVHLPFGLAVIGLFNNLQWGYETAPQDQLRQRNLVWPRGRVLGGSSAVNAMIYARGMRADYDGWAALGATGWDYASVLPYFRKAEANQRGGDGTQTLRAIHEVLLSAGAINSPHLLMLSGIGPAEHLRSHGIDVVHDAPFVGQRLADYLDVVTQLTSRIGARGGLGFQWNVPARSLRWTQQWLSRRGGTFASNVAEAGGFVKSDPALDRPDIQFHFLPARMANHGRQLVWGYGYTLHACNLYPRSEGEIRLASADPAAPPIMDPRYLTDPDGHDIRVLMAALDWSRRILAAPAFDDIRGRELQPGTAVQTEDQIRDWVARTAETVYHPVGTVAMGAADDPRASLTPDLRVKGVDGLRVVDASVMPRLIGGNTNAPTIMIAEKAAEMILDAVRTGAKGPTP